jgi:S-adenosylmethionine uptake transporter
MTLLTPTLTGALCAVAAFSLYSLNDITVKFLGTDYHPAQIVFFSGMAGIPLVVLQMMADRQGGTLRPVLPGWTAVRMAIVIVNGLLVTYTFASLPLSQSYAIFFMMPLFICLLAVPMLGEKLGLVRGTAVLAGLVGVLVVLRPGGEPLQWAHLAALLAASLGALYYIILRRTGGVERMAVILLYPMMAQVAAMALFLPFVYLPMPALHLGLIGLMALEGFAGSLLIVAAYRLAPAVVVAPMQYVQIIVATIFGVILFDERMDAMTALGIAIIIAAGLVILLRPAPPHRPPPKPAESPAL